MTICKQNFLFKVGIVVSLSWFTAPSITLYAQSVTDPASTPPKLMPTREDMTRETASQMVKSDQDEQASIASTLREGGIVMRHGLKYYAFRSNLGVLLVPASGRDVSPQDFDAALCTSAPETRTYVGETASGGKKVRQDTPEQRLVLGTEKPLSKKFTLYAGLMAKVFRQKCGIRDNVPINPATTTPEVGLHWDNGSKTGGQDKLFLSPMGAGFGISF